MTAEEYREWFNHHGDLFPDFKKWWGSIGGESRTALAVAWREILTDIPLRNAKAASQRILAGLSDPIPAWERSLLAAHIKAAAHEVASLRIDRIRKDYADKERLAYRSQRGASAGDAMGTVLERYGCGKAYREILQRVDGGEDREAVTAEVCERVRQG